MATVLDIITDALAEIGVASPGETVSPEDEALGLKKLNRLISSWTAEKLAIAGITVIDFSSGGSETYTFGAGGTGSTTRPVAIVAVGVVNSNRSQVVRMVDAGQYNDVLDKSRAGLFAEVGYYNAGFPLGTLYLSPKPTAAGTVRVHAIAPVAAYSTITDTVTVAPGVERALVSGLAMDLVPSYGAPGGAPQIQALAMLAKEAKQALVQLTAEVLAGSAAALAHSLAQMQAEAK
jgi:hypothetical protein